MPATQQLTLPVDIIKQYGGQEQVTRAVKVQAPGKFFNNLTPAERA